MISPSRQHLERLINHLSQRFRLKQDARGLDTQVNCQLCQFKFPKRNLFKRLLSVLPLLDFVHRLFGQQTTHCLPYRTAAVSCLSEAGLLAMSCRKWSTTPWPKINMYDCLYITGKLRSVCEIYDI